MKKMTFEQNSKQDSTAKLASKVNVNQVNVTSTSDNKNESCLSKILDNTMSIYHNTCVEMKQQTIADVKLIVLIN